tara:strand:+ start:11141 stop:11287 length:147 start_codon:yes stop_codon:yes gene_type:complete
MKVKIKDRRMKQRVVIVSREVVAPETWNEDSIWVVKIEPICGEIFGDI